MSYAWFHVMLLARPDRYAMRTITKTHPWLKRVFEQILKETLEGAPQRLETFIKSRYTYKNAMSRMIRPKIKEMNARIQVRGPRQPIKRFNSVFNKGPGSHMAVEIVRGQRGIIPRAFRHQTYRKYMYRVHGPRLPIKVITGLSPAVMAGKEPEVAPKFESWLRERLSSRIAANGPIIEALVGGGVTRW